MQALADANGNIIAADARPGNLGNLSQNFLTGPGVFRLDLNLIKRIAFTEQKEIVIRADALNATNHTIFLNPDTNISATTFGRISGTAPGTNRIVALSARFNF